LAAKKTKTKAKTAEGLEGSGNINQIRDILIGPFQRDQQAAIARLEQRIERFAAEASEQAEQTQDRLHKSLEASMTMIEARLSECVERLSKVEAGARRETEDLAKSLGRELCEVDQKLRNEIESSASSAEKRLAAFRLETDEAMLALRDEKTGRADLGDYLTEIGMRLKGEQALSALESSLQDALDAEPRDDS